MTLRATPLDQTSIQTGGRRRELAKSRLARRGFYRVSHGGSRRPPGGGKSKAGGGSSDQAERRRKSSLFRRLSSKRASAEIQQVDFLFDFMFWKITFPPIFLFTFTEYEVKVNTVIALFNVSLSTMLVMSV